MLTQSCSQNILMGAFARILNSDNVSPLPINTVLATLVQELSHLYKHVFEYSDINSCEFQTKCSRRSQIKIQLIVIAVRYMDKSSI